MRFGRLQCGDLLAIGIELSVTSLVARRLFPNPDGQSYCPLFSFLCYCRTLRSLLCMILLSAVLAPIQFDILLSVRRPRCVAFSSYRISYIVDSEMTQYINFVLIAPLYSLPESEGTM